MELIKNFGIDPFLLGAQIINFLIVLYFLKRFLYKPILEMLKKRQSLIKEGIQKSEEASTKLIKVLEEEKTILKRAEAQAKKIIDDAKKQIIEQSQEIGENAKKQAEKLLAEAKEQIEQEAKETEKRLSVNVSQLALNFLKKALEGLFSETQQKEILKKALKKIKTK